MSRLPLILSRETDRAAIDGVIRDPGRRKILYNIVEAVLGVRETAAVTSAEIARKNEADMESFPFPGIFLVHMDRDGEEHSLIAICAYTISGTVNKTRKLKQAIAVPMV